MKFLKKIKSSNFWVSMISAVVLILQAVFNVDIKTEYLNQIILGILGVLVMSGIVTDSPSDEVTVKQTFDFDKMQEMVSSMFNQISTTLQTDITKMISQVEKINTTQNQICGEVNNENDERKFEVEELKVDKEIEISVEKVENKLDAIIQPQASIIKNTVPKNEL